MCGVVVKLDGRRVLDVRGDPDDPFSHGHICPKAIALKDVHEDPNRLTEPLIKENGAFRSATWDEAFERTVEGIQAVQAAHGKSAMAMYQGNPSVHAVGTLLYAILFAQALRTKNHFSATSLDQLPHMLAGYTMFGHQLVLPVPDLDRTDLLIVHGANPLVSNGSLMSAGDIRARLRGIKQRGGRIVVLDPRRTETAKYADEHVFIRPGTDALLLAAVAHVLLERGVPDLGDQARYLDGLERLPPLFARYAPEAVAGPTGVPADSIRALAESFRAAKRAAWYGRIGVCTQEFGGLCGWLIYLVNILAGRLDREGGMMFASPAVDLVDIANKIGRKGSFDRRRSRVRGLPEFGGEYPAATLADEILTPGDGQIRGLVTSAGNPVLSTPGGERLDEALEQLDFMVSIDIYVNETTRHADVILPPTFGIERAHFDLAFHLLAVQNTVKYSPPAFERGPQQRHDWEIFGELYRRMRSRGKLTSMAAPVVSPIERMVLKQLGPDRILALALRFGPYGEGFAPTGEGVSMHTLKDSPHGIDLGPLVPRLPERLETDNGHVQLVPDTYLGDLERLAARLDRTAPEGTLSLIGRRELRSNNSWMHNAPSLMSGKSRCTLRMHPDDASARALTDTATVRVTSAVGAVEVPLEVTDEVMPGVVSLPHGYGHGRRGVRLEVAQAHAGVSVNDLTDPGRLDALTGNARFSDVPVTVEALSP